MEGENNSIGGRKQIDRRSDAPITVIETNHFLPAAEIWVEKDGKKVRTSGRKDNNVGVGRDHSSNEL